MYAITIKKYTNQIFVVFVATADALSLLAMQGGYYNALSSLTLDRSTHHSTSFVPPENYPV